MHASTYINVNSCSSVSGLVGGVQQRHELGRVQTGVVGQCARHDLECLGVLFEGVLVQACLSLSKRTQSACQLDLDCSGASHEAWIADQGLEAVDSIVCTRRATNNIK